MAAPVCLQGGACCDIRASLLQGSVLFSHLWFASASGALGPALSAEPSGAHTSRCPGLPGQGSIYHGPLQRPEVLRSQGRWVATSTLTVGSCDDVDRFLIYFSLGECNCVLHVTWSWTSRRRPQQSRLPALAHRVTSGHPYLRSSVFSSVKWEAQDEL